MNQEKPVLIPCESCSHREVCYYCGQIAKIKSMLEKREIEMQIPAVLDDRKLPVHLDLFVTCDTYLSVLDYVCCTIAGDTFFQNKNKEDFINEQE